MAGESLMQGTAGLRLAAASATLAVAMSLSVSAGVASAQTSAPYFSALPASGATELQTARYGAAAATLPNGEILIAGGESNSGVLQSAELFNPADDTFTALPATGATELQTPRYAGVAATLPNGQVLIAGGLDSGGGVLQSAELFDPATDTFTALPASGELQVPRAGSVAAALPDGQVLIAGGYNSGGGILQSAELFNPATDTFTELSASGSSELQTPRAGAVAASLPDGQVLIAGGEAGSGYLQSAELFNPATDTFSALPASGSTELQVPRAGAVAAPLPDGQVLIAGGGDATDYQQNAELFNPSDDTFTALPATGGTQPTSERVLGVGMALPDGQVLIAGGVDPSGALQTAELYISAPQAAVTGVDFGDQTEGQPSAPQSVVLTNIGGQALTVSNATLGNNGNPGDFAIVADTCLNKTLAFKESCTITARFTPSVAGAESATIDLSDNEPTASTITLSGTGVAPSGSASGGPGVPGTPGTPGRTQASGAGGAANAQSPQSNANQVRLITCQTVIKTVRVHGQKRSVSGQKCTTKLIAGAAGFGTTTAKATLTRHGVIYGTGTALLTRLTLHVLRPLRSGQYTLTLTRQLSHHRVQTYRVLTIEGARAALG
jgi:hypothetical protein